MTTLQTIEQFTETSKDLIAEVCFANSWTSTSYLIQLLCKLESYFESLNEQHPEDDYYTAQVAISSALELINSTYNVPIDDERFEPVEKLYQDTVIHFIDKLSDDALADLIYLCGLANWVASMRTYNWNQVLETGKITESTVKALKLAKRDEKAVELAVKTAASVLFPED